MKGYHTNGVHWINPASSTVYFNTRRQSIDYTGGDSLQALTRENEKLGAAGVPERALDCQLYQRSGDLFLGVPFNIASYALLTHMVATVTNHLPGTFVHTLGDAHLYQNHVEQARTQLDREPLPPPSLHLNPAVDDLFAFTFEDITIVGYESHPAIKAPVAV